MFVTLCALMQEHRSSCLLRGSVRKMAHNVRRNQHAFHSPTCLHDR